MDKPLQEEFNEYDETTQEDVEIDFNNLDDGHLDYYFNEECVDYWHHFTTSQTFDSKKDVVEWARGVARTLNMYLVIVHSTESTKKYGGRVELRCERSGQPGNSVVNSKRIDCPFSLKCIERVPKSWFVRVQNGKNNHSMGIYAEGHATSGRLDMQKRELFERLSKNMTPKQVLSQLKIMNKSDSTTIKQIYNCLNKIKMRKKQGRIVFEQLVKVLVEHNYSYWFRIDEERKSLQVIIFLHPWSVKCLNSFPYMLVMDTTYNTNRYKQPLLEIVGFTSTWKIFIVAYAFLNCEDKETFVWALECLKLVMKDLSNVIVTDKDRALIYAVEHVFFTSAYFLCQCHIQMDIENYVTKMMSNNIMGKSVVGKWKTLIASRTKKEFLNG